MFTHGYRAMDPITVIVAALAAGAAAGLKPAAEQAIKDAYQGLKALIQARYQDVALTPLEKKPDSQAQQVALTESLNDTPAREDTELLQKAEALLAAIEAHEPQAAEAVGVDLKRVRAGAVYLQDIHSTGPGTGVRGEDWDVQGNVDIRGVRAGGETKKL